MILDALTDDERYSGFDGDPSLTDSFALESMKSYPSDLPFDTGSPPASTLQQTTDDKSIMGIGDPQISQAETGITDSTQATNDETISLDEEFLKTVRGDLQRSKEHKDRKNQQENPEHDPLEELQSVLAGKHNDEVMAAESIDAIDPTPVVERELLKNIPDPVVDTAPIDTPADPSKLRIEDVSLEEGAEFSSAFAQPKKRYTLYYYAAAAILLLTVSGAGAWWFFTKNAAHPVTAHNGQQRSNSNASHDVGHTDAAVHSHTSGTHDSTEHTDTQSQHQADTTSHTAADTHSVAVNSQGDQTQTATHDTHTQLKNTVKNVHQKTDAHSTATGQHSPTIVSQSKHSDAHHANTHSTTSIASHAPTTKKETSIHQKTAHTTNHRDDTKAHTAVKSTSSSPKPSGDAQHAQRIQHKSEPENSHSKSDHSLSSHIPAKKESVKVAPPAPTAPKLEKLQSMKDTKETNSAKTQPNSSLLPSKSVSSTPATSPDQTKLVPKPVLRDVPASPNGIFTVQVYATPSRDDAEEWMERLKDKNVSGAFITTQSIRGQTYYRVRFGTYQTRQEAEIAAMKLGYSAGWVDRVR
ncbi:MAG: SPOR domain-containing protein [Candidatus Kapabacteria bacterium]|nr:SPOR domain-containing protein [Candidatus Kapabacteria bacterium]